AAARQAEDHYVVSPGVLRQPGGERTPRRTPIREACRRIGADAHVGADYVAATPFGDFTARRSCSHGSRQPAGGGGRAGALPRARRPPAVPALDRALVHGSELARAAVRPLAGSSGGAARARRSVSAVRRQLPRAERPHVRDAQRPAGHLVLQPRRLEPRRRPRRPPPLPPALLPRADRMATRRRRDPLPLHAAGGPAGAVRRRVQPRRRRLPPRAWNARALPRRALLPLRPAPGPALPRRDPPRAVATPAGGGAHRGRHDAAAGPRLAGAGAASALLGPNRRRDLAPRGDREQSVTQVTQCYLLASRSCCSARATASAALSAAAREAAAADSARSASRASSRAWRCRSRTRARSSFARSRCSARRSGAGFGAGLGSTPASAPKPVASTSRPSRPRRSSSWAAGSPGAALSVVATFSTTASLPRACSRSRRRAAATSSRTTARSRSLASRIAAVSPRPSASRWLSASWRSSPTLSRSARASWFTVQAATLGFWSRFTSSASSFRPSLR